MNRAGDVSAADPGTSGFVELDRGDGVRLHYVDRGVGRDGTVVFLHGWPDSWFSFRLVLPLLPSSIRCLAVDQRGFGDSPSSGSGYSIPEMASDVLSFLETLDVGPVILVGHSYGSFVAREVALTDPARLSALVLIGTGFVAANPTTREVQAALRDLADPIPPDFVREFQSGTIHHPVPPEFFEGILSESRKLPADLWRRSFDGLLEHDDSERLGQIATPTLLLWGDEDALFSRADQDRLLHAIPSGRLKIYADTGHCPNWERPDRVAADIEDVVVRSRTPRPE